MWFVWVVGIIIFSQGVASLEKLTSVKTVNILLVLVLIVLFANGCASKPTFDVCQVFKDRSAMTGTPHVVSYKACDGSLELSKR